MFSGATIDAAVAALQQDLAESLAEDRRTLFVGLGSILLLAVLLMAPILNRIPLAALAAVLLVTGYKLATPSIWRTAWPGRPCTRADRVTKSLPECACFVA